MDHARCPSCGYDVGLGMASEPGYCPSCNLPLMLTCEFRALTQEQVLAEAKRRMEHERKSQVG